MATPQSPAIPPAETPTFGEKWAFRAFVLLFILTLLVGLLHYLFSFLKYRS